MDKLVIMMKILCVLLYFTYCKGVSEDYFLDNDEPTSKEIAYENKSLVNSSQSEQLKALKRTNTTTESNQNVTTFLNNTLLNNYGDYEDVNIDEIINESNIAVGERISGVEYIDTDDITTCGYDDHGGNHTNVSNKNLRLDITKDYVYIYDEPVTVARQALRDDIESDMQGKSNKTLKANNTIDQEEETREKLLIDFYNLQPADSKLYSDDSALDRYTYFDIQKYVNNSVWYVPENLPCWDLPILYGELGQPKKKDVFLTFSGKLKNVIEKYEEEKFAHKKFNIPVSQTVNKWCAADPCYGDHTLCLFSETTNSKLCVNDYEVLTPTMEERIGLVNTVNTMRNRVATGVADLYPHLPTAADMKQIIYDFDLQTMAEAWLRQCLPGPSACLSLDSNYAAQLECTKHTEHCCIKSFKTEMGSRCIPQHECFINPIVGCIHTWFRSGVQELTATDVECGHITPTTFNTVQLIWAATNKIGCAYGRSPWGDVRVVCNFAPGAPFSIYTKSFCGFIQHKEMLEEFNDNITSSKFLGHLGIFLRPTISYNTTFEENAKNDLNFSLRFSDIDILSKIYTRTWLRKQLNNYVNGTIGLIARLVTKYTFGDDSGPQCDTSRHIYEPGVPGSMCVEIGRRFQGLCYDFRDPTPGYRLVAVLAPVALFSLILYDLFSGVVRQTNY